MPEYEVTGRGVGGWRVFTFEDKNAVRWSWMVTSSGVSGTVAPRAAIKINATHWKRMKSHSLVARLYSPTRSS